MYIGVMSKRKTPARYELGEPLNSELEDLSEAFFGAPATRLVREAVQSFISERLAEETEVRIRYEAARKKRLPNNGTDLKIVDSEKD